MHNGFYALQKSFAGNVRGFLNALDCMEADLPINISLEPDDYEPASVCVGSFLQGYCAHLAFRLANNYGFDIRTMEYQGELVHVFNTFQSPTGSLFYLDARGVTDDAKLFCEPFGSDVFSISESLSRLDVEKRMDAEGWAFAEDPISDAMVEWLISSFPENFAPAFRRKEEKVSLNDRICAAEQKDRLQKIDRPAYRASFKLER